MKLSATSRATLDAWAKRGQGVAATSPLEIVNDAVRSGRLTRAKVRDALRTRDDWSPEARAAAARARKLHAGRARQHSEAARGFQPHVRTTPNAQESMTAHRNAAKLHRSAHAAAGTSEYTTKAAKANAATKNVKWNVGKPPTGDDDDWDEGRKPNVGRAVLTLGTLRDALRKRRTCDGNFQKLEHSLAHENGVTDPAALAASIGRKKYGAAGMARKSEAGR